MAKWLLIAGICASLGAAAFAGQGCIADLDTTVPPLPDTGPPPTGRFCGDNIIDLDAGEQCDPGEASIPGCGKNCQVECPDGGLVVEDHCYFFVAPNKGIEDAQKACQQGGGPAAHVVTFASDDEWKAVRDWVPEGDPFWIGIKRDVVGGYAALIDEPGWNTSARCTGCYAYTFDASVQLPFPLQPDGSPVPGTNCVVGTKDASVSWAQEVCAVAGVRTIRVLCEREPEGNTIEPCNGVFCARLRHTADNKRYVYVPTPTTYSAAASGCTALGGKLVVLQSREEREQLWRQLATLQTPPFQVWIGLTRIDPPDGGDGGSTWVWDDGTPTLDGGYPLPWGDRQPPAGRAAAPRAQAQRLEQSFDNQLARAEQDAGALLPYVCQIP